MENENGEKIISVANGVISLSKNTVLCLLRFMSPAVNKLEIKLEGEKNVLPYLDGNALYISPYFTLKSFTVSPHIVTRTYLHALLHCVFRHPFASDKINIPLWNLSCDIAVENVINGLGFDAFEVDAIAKQTAFINNLKENVKTITAERIYAYLKDNADIKTLSAIAGLFAADDHDRWFSRKTVPPSDDGEGKGESDKNENCGGNDGDFKRNEKNEKEWTQISKKIESDLNSFSKKIGEGHGDISRCLSEINREKHDYGDFLKRFSSLHETMKINDDEFDTVFYTYGLGLYGNVPLIEPLEYKDEKKIRDFVVAIDTSGSVDGETVRRFVTKTYNILKSEESFFSRINVHIVQCDEKVQSDVKITSKNDFERFMKDFKLSGFGGTDFRPVFSYVDGLIKNGEFSDFGGLIYFTDGLGVFPKEKPEYKTAFVFLDGDDGISVPPWAIKLTLESDGIS